MKFLYILTSIMFGLLGCSGSDDEQSQQELSGIPYEHQLIECGSSNATTIEQASQEVIQSAHRFREVYGVTDLNSQEDVPEIDFTSQNVVALHAGMKGNPGHGLRFDDVVTDGESIIVRYTNLLPDSSGNCAYPAVVVYPYCFVAIAKSDLPVIYSSIEHESSCSG